MFKIKYLKMVSIFCLINKKEAKQVIIAVMNTNNTNKIKPFLSHSDDHRAAARLPGQPTN